MLKHLPSDKAAGPDGITNRILQASGEQAIDMIYLYMFIIWEVETYPGAWASALMQPMYKGGRKDRHSPVSYRGIYLLNTLTKLFEGLMEARLSKFKEFNDTLTPSQQGSRITRQTHDAIYALIATAASQKEADLALPSLASVWQNLSSNYEQNSHSFNSLKSHQLMTSTRLEPSFMSMTWFS